MRYNTEFWLALVLPTLLGLFFVGYSVWKLISNSNSIGHMILTIINVLLNGLALYILIQMLIGAWPTLLPHLLILLSVPFVITQWKYKGS